MILPPPCLTVDVFRFHVLPFLHSMFQNSMNLPPDKVRLLRSYDNEKKWELICDQERFQVKNPPHTYIQKLRGFLDPAVTRKKFRRRVQESTQMLRELEISLRTNHIGWVREFLNEENRGLDVLVEYLSFAHSTLVTRSNTLPSRRTLKNSRLVCKKDDVHVCVMCLRAIMNYQYGFNMVMSHPHAVNEIALSLNNRNPRTKALVLELLAAVCLVRGGHEIILSAFDHFKTVCSESMRFEKLMEHFKNEDDNIDFLVACMQFINIVVHSVEDMNFRVHLQYDFTKLNLDDHLEHTESDRLQVQIQAYLDNVFDVGTLLEDAETKTAALERVEELEENLGTVRHLDAEDRGAGEALLSPHKRANSQVHTLRRMSVYHLSLSSLSDSHLSDSHLSVYHLSLSYLSVYHLSLSYLSDSHLSVYHLSDSHLSLLTCLTPTCLSHLSPLTCLTPTCLSLTCLSLTCLSLPVCLSPVSLSPVSLSPVSLLPDLDVEEFEEMFKTKAQGPAVDLTLSRQKLPQKAPSKVSLLEANRAKNLAITLRKAGQGSEVICRAIHTFDLRTVRVDFVECLMRFLPTDSEVKLLRQYERDRKPLEALSDEDRFMLQFSRIERLSQRMNIMTFMGNFTDNVQMLTPQLHAIIAASVSIKSSQKLKKILEIILALGNYMNSSKRGAVYGFKLQSLDLLLETKSTDRKQTLLHYIANVVREKYSSVSLFYNELHYVDKAAAVSLENVLCDVKELQRGMELTWREFSVSHNATLKDFISRNESRLSKLQEDARIAQDAFEDAVKFFGESSKTMPPSVFFPIFVRFIKAYRLAEEENEQRRRQEQMLLEKLEQEEQLQEEEETKSPSHRGKRQQQELITELRRRQGKDSRHVYEGKDGAIEDIITALKTVPFTARSAKRSSRFFCDPAHSEEHY
uniref:Formin-like 2b n=1 Tax=Amphiprion ocellaris TaxID=80972 RepID=A0AAQ6A7Q0_AMPOC